MILGFVEPTGESSDLARAEIRGAVVALGGSLARAGPGDPLGLVAVEVPTPADLIALAHRLALARRCLWPVAASSDLEAAALEEGRRGGRAVFRRLGRPSSSPNRVVNAAGAAYVRGGGTIDLERPDRRYWIGSREDESLVLFEEAAAVDRRSISARSMPRLPFQRPVSLPPLLARVAANLASVVSGSRVADPFVGTGALLAEAALLGGRTRGVDRDPEMVRGALRNFAHLGVSAESIVEGDARLVGFDPGDDFDAIVTDPPYGRASGSGGEDPNELVREVLDRWQHVVRPNGRIVVITPAGPGPLRAPWNATVEIPVRVHRSLTRVFRAYERVA